MNISSYGAYDACLAAEGNPGCDILKYQRIACSDPGFAYRFARMVKGADIKYCQKHACKVPHEALLFTIDIPEADIEYCYKNSAGEWRKGIGKFIVEGL